MTTSRIRRSAALALTAATLGAVLAPGAALADGPGYGGTADALTVQWEQQSGLAVYAVGFRGGSDVQLQLGSLDDQTVAADISGALRILVVDTTSAVQDIADTTVLRVAAGTGNASAGTSILVTGETPAGSLRKLVGSVPPASAGTGASDVVPWTAAAGALIAGAVWFSRRGLALTLGMEKPGRHRPGRHRMGAED